ncbi:hypothetical protein J699_00064 [Acinetobacter sp. 1000160]|nr:hypothetical protein J537_0606 [Acinetobacter baumannii 1437282]EXB47349.1 hypothetical protein J522_2002 [Acinetobacter baumannii 146457]EYT23851.1 hypothetical protein J699_00064 [Acinetobacter sp. 1000160]
MYYKSYRDGSRGIAVPINKSGYLGAINKYSLCLKSKLVYSKLQREE